MSHRLQHLQKRKMEGEQAVFQSQGTKVPNNYEQSSPSHHKANNPDNKNVRPLFNPTNIIQQYDRSGYKQGEMPFPPPQSLYAVKHTQIDPCFLRASTAALHNIPRKTNLPIAVWITPFASEKVHVVGVRAPLRCTRCKGYVNPYFQFDGTNRSATCNLCNLRFNVQQNVDKNNIQSAQIASESIIDFRVTDKFYFKKRTDVIKIIVVIEVSMHSIELGVVSTVISSLKSTFQTHTFEDKIQIGIVFYTDHGVGFLRKGYEGQQPTIYLVPNNKNNLFCSPLCDDEFLFAPNSQREQLGQTLDFLQSYADNLWSIGKFIHQANYISAIKSIKQLFENETGKIVLFSLLDPKSGPFSIRIRTQQQVKLPLKSMNEEFTNLAKQLVRARIGVEHFYFSKDNLVSHELASTHHLASLTGGHLHLYNNYHNDVHALHLYYNIFHAFTRPQFFDADFTCRTSTGLTVLRYGVNQGLRESRDVGLSVVSNTSSFTVQIDQQQKLEQHSGAFIQFALMYTNGSGERRIRVINYKFDVSPRLEAVYDSIDYLTFANIVAKTYTHRLLRSDPAKSRQEAINWIGNIIGQFKSKCANGVTSKLGDLQLPHRLVWALSYLQTILNGKLFLSHVKTTSDLRIYEYLKIHGSNPYFFATRFYPHVYPLTLDIYDTEPLPGDFLEEEQEGESKIAILPRTISLTKKSFSDEGVYLFDAVDQIIIFVQSQADQQLLNQLFNTPDWETIQSEGLPELETSHNIRVNNIIAEIRRRSSFHGGMYQPLVIKTPQKKGPYGQLLFSVLKQDYYDCSFPNFIEAIKRAIVIPK